MMEPLHTDPSTPTSKALSRRLCSEESVAPTAYCSHIDGSGFASVRAIGPDL